MAKRSIFSRDYERRKRKKRRRIILAVSILLVIIIGAFIKIKVANMDFSNFKEKVQNWAESGKSSEQTVENTDKNEIASVTQESTASVTQESTATVTNEQNRTVQLKVSDTVTINAQLEKENGIDKFVSTSPVANISTVISPQGSEVLVLDQNQDMKVFKTDGTMNDITKKQYVSQSGKAFEKDNILKSNPAYLWHSQAKFIDETKVISVSQLPYFGSAAVNKYIWITDIASGQSNAIFKLAGPDTTVGELDPANGMNVTVNSVKYFVKGDGTFVQAPIQ